MTAAYAAVVSLLNTMDQIKIHPRLSPCFGNDQFESLREKGDFFLDFVENYSGALIREEIDFDLEDFVTPDADNSTEAVDLVRRIAIAAHEAEDIIEIEAANRIRDNKSPSFLHDLQKIFQDLDSIKEKVIKVKKEAEFINSMPLPSSSSSAPLATAKKTNTLVGFDGYIYQLLDELTGHDSGRKIIPIIGTGGIGKTTLARNVYENSIIIHHFNVRAWVTVSQEFSARNFFLQALSCLGVSTSDKDTASDEQLSLELHQVLYNRRYLFVLDDVWSVKDWDRIKHFFPENKNRSRIVVTTRELKLVDYLGLSSCALAVDFLDDKYSWDLFCDNTFAAQGCPTELEAIGTKIVKKCKGLPLAIVVIGGLLGKSPKSQEYWEKFAKEEHLVLEYSGEGNNPLGILYLSFKYLPVCLKLCVLYLGLCSDYYVDVPELIKLWVAEGFIKPKADKSLEQSAKSYIDELVDRNLLLLRSVRLNTKIGSCGVHDLVRDLCTRIAERENVFCVQRDKDGNGSGRRHVTVDEGRTRFYPRDILSIDRPIIFGGQLRVAVRDMRRLDYTFPEINLRFLYHEPDDDDEYRDFDPRDYWMVTYVLPSSISLLWRLQTIIISEISDVVAPSEIWEMPQLRHIEMSSVCIPDPPPGDIVVVLENLQTLCKVENLIFTENVCKRIPNIKELGICYDLSEGGGPKNSGYHLHDVGSLNKLETLRYSCSGWKYLEDSTRKNLELPSSLKELNLQGWKLESGDIKIIGSLPHLEVLVLRNVVGPEWNFVEEEFVCLKYLRIEECDDLVCWNVDRSSLPVLETLSLESLSKLGEIPLDIGEIPTLERIYMYNCKESASMSAIDILEEMESFGNLDLQLEIKFRDKSEAQAFRENVEFSSQNLIISSFR